MASRSAMSHPPLPITTCHPSTRSFSVSASCITLLTSQFERQHQQLKHDSRRAPLRGARRRSREATARRRRWPSSCSAAARTISLCLTNARGSWALRTHAPRRGLEEDHGVLRRAGCAHLARVRLVVLADRHDLLAGGSKAAEGESRVDCQMIGRGGGGRTRSAGTASRRSCWMEEEELEVIARS